MAKLIVKNKNLRLIASIVLVISVVVLIIGGIPAESIEHIITKISAVITALYNLIEIILEWLKDD